jgi:hypothetical protein
MHKHDASASAQASMLTQSTDGRTDGLTQKHHRPTSIALDPIRPRLAKIHKIVGLYLGSVMLVAFISMVVVLGASAIYGEAARPFMVWVVVVDAAIASPVALIGIPALAVAIIRDSLKGRP